MEPKEASYHATQTMKAATELYNHRHTIPTRAAPVPERPVTRPVFAHYVKQNYKTMRSQLGGHGDTMKALSEKYRSNN